MGGSWSPFAQRRSSALVLSGIRKESPTVQSKFAVSGSFVADKACQETAQAFGPAVQKLIEDVVRHPKVKQIARRAPTRQKSPAPAGSGLSG
jgi:hypothetical protein